MMIHNHDEFKCLIQVYIFSVFPCKKCKRLLRNLIFLLFLWQLKLFVIAIDEREREIV